MVRRTPWLFIILGLFAIACVIGTGLWAYWSYADQLPSYTPPRVVLPVPNAYDDYRRAGAMSQAVGGCTVLLPGLTRPLPPASPSAPQTMPGLVPIRGAMMRNGQPVQGYADDAPLEQVRAVVVRNRPALARLRQGFGKAYRNPPVVSVRQMFPEMADFRELARVLLTEGKLAEREGRMGDAARSYLDCLRLGGDVPRGGLLIHGLVGIAIQALGLSALDRAADRIDSSTAAATARELFRLGERTPGVADVLAGEKEYGMAAHMDMLRQRPGLRQIASMVSIGSSGAPSVSDIVMGLKFTFTPKRQILANYRSYMDALIADARKPYYARRPSPPLPSDPLNQIMLPVFDQAGFKWVQIDVARRILAIRLAVRAYRLRYGAPPSSQDALVPTYLPSVPRDPFANKPLVYRVQRGRPIVYSRGPDGDDDGGRDLGYLARPGQDGDIVSTEIARRNFGPGN